MSSTRIIHLMSNVPKFSKSCVLQRLCHRKLLKICKLAVASHNVCQFSSYDFYRTKRCKHSGTFICIGLSIGISLLSYHQYNKRDLKFKDSVNFVSLPKVHAAEVFDPGMGSSKTRSSPVRSFNFIADVVEKAAPAVVYIEIKARHPFFGGGPIAVANGSGFIVRADGLIVTNAHVVANMRSVTVKLYDGRVFEGQVKMFDRDSDLATIKINTKNLPILKLGTSSKVRPGEWVVAMGSPLSLSNTITAGVISSVNRGSKELGLRKEMEYIQTDAAINFGNSGGPLVNLDGEVIGISTMKVTTGISFAIPVDYVSDFLRRSREIEEKSPQSKGWLGGNASPEEPTKRRYLGVTMLTLNPNLVLELHQRSQDFPLVPNGVLVWKVIVGSPAHWGGIQPGDIITSINDKPVHSAKDVYTSLENQSSVVVTVRRKKEILKLSVNLQD